MNLYDTLNADLEAVLADPIGPGEDVTLTAQGAEAPAAILRGVFDRGSLEVNPGSRAPALSRRPLVMLKEQAVLAALGRPLMRRDKISVRGQAYQVEAPLPDGLGTVAVKLFLEDGKNG